MAISSLLLAPPLESFRRRHTGATAAIYVRAARQAECPFRACRSLNVLPIHPNGWGTKKADPLRGGHVPHLDFNHFGLRILLR